MAGVFLLPMAKELYLYSPIYDFVAEELVTALEANSDQDITLRINSPGGQVLAGWGIIAKMGERSGQTIVKVDGGAMSMAAMICAFADRVECLDVSTFMLHRASGYVENDEDKAWLARINKDLRSRLESKIDSDKMKELTGYSVKDLFEGEKAIDLFMDAKTAKAVGLVDKINKVVPKEVMAFNNKFFKTAATGAAVELLKPKTMTKEEFKAAHPAAYAEIFDAGKIAGATEMKQIAEAWAHFAATDSKACAAGIKSGVAMTQLEMIELTQKSFSPKALAGAETDSAAALSTGQPEGGDKEKKEIEAKKASVLANSTFLKVS